MLESGRIHWRSSCQWIERIWQGDGEAIAQIRVPRTNEVDDAYQLPLGIIDAGFQLLAATAEDERILANFESFKFFGYFGNQLWGQVLPHGAIARDIRLFDDAGKLVAEITNVQLKRVSRESLERVARAGKNSSVQLPTDRQDKSSLSWEKLLAADPMERQHILEKYLLEKLASSLQIPLAKLNPQQSLGLMVDSLIALELRSRIEADLQVLMPMEKFLGENSIAQLASALLERLALASLILSEPSETNISKDMEEILL